MLQKCIVVCWLMPGFHSHVPSIRNVRAVTVAVVPLCRSVRTIAVDGLRTNGKNRSRSYCNGTAAMADISNGTTEFFFT